jgi:pantetheine-phosphate adenylyltransferase
LKSSKKVKKQAVKISKPTVAVYAGSFDPITRGHEDIVARMSMHFDKFLVVVAESTSKQYWFDSSQRMQLVKKSLSHLSNVEVFAHGGLIADFAKQHGARVLVRGLRAVSDFEYEMAMSHINRDLWSELETMIILARPELGHLSSRMIKEVARHGGDVSGMVSPHVAQALRKYLSQL